MNPRMVGTAGPLKGTALALADDEISVGRDPSNKLWAADSAMSRRHCAIVQQQDGQLLLRDLGGRNGTWVNGEKIEKHELCHHDQISVGNSTLVFLLADEDPVESQLLSKLQQICGSMTGSISQWRNWVASCVFRSGACLANWLTCGYVRRSLSGRFEILPRRLLRTVRRNTSSKELLNGKRKFRASPIAFSLRHRIQSRHGSRILRGWSRKESRTSATFQGRTPLLPSRSCTATCLGCKCTQRKTGRGGATLPRELGILWKTHRLARCSDSPQTGGLSWLRGVDLNHRPLGYEFKGKLIRNNLHAHG